LPPISIHGAVPWIDQDDHIKATKCWAFLAEGRMPWPQRRALRGTG
jgi:hypothetical protein